MLKKSKPCQYTVRSALERASHRLRADVGRRVEVIRTLSSAWPSCSLVYWKVREAKGVIVAPMLLKASTGKHHVNKVSLLVRGVIARKQRGRRMGDQLENEGSPDRKKKRLKTYEKLLPMFLKSMAAVFFGARVSACLVDEEGEKKGRGETAIAVREKCWSRAGSWDGGESEFVCKKEKGIRSK